MTISVLFPGESTPQLLTFSQVAEALGITYLTRLEFLDSALYHKVAKRCAEEEKKKWIDPRQKWLGSYYSREIHNEVHPDIALTWINPLLGYGVFANRGIPRNAYVGEFTGMLRKRSLFGRLKNRYCFNYTIGFGRQTPYVIDAERYGNFSRYINHSDHPNLETASVLSGGIMHIIFYAIRDIPQGSQLCYDYGWRYWEKREKPIPLENS